jgi:hypothetical protein
VYLCQLEKGTRIILKMATNVTGDSGKLDMNDPQVRKLVYNMYRGILGSYNDQANTTLKGGPEKKVVQDKGVYDQIESMAKSLQKP